MGEKRGRKRGRREMEAGGRREWKKVRDEKEDGKRKKREKRRVRLQLAHSCSTLDRKRMLKWPCGNEAECTFSGVT